jgi:SAM-dependent methyltransferase
MPCAADRLKAFYELRAAETPQTDPEAVLRFDKALEIAGLRPGEQVLDVGAKRGELGLRARETGCRIHYTGLELSEENVRTAALDNLDVRQADVTKRLPITDAQCDCVFCLELLEHLTSPVTLLDEMRRVLKSDGRAVLSVPSPWLGRGVQRAVRPGGPGGPPDQLYHPGDAEPRLARRLSPRADPWARRSGSRRPYDSSRPTRSSPGHGST